MGRRTVRLLYARHPDGGRSSHPQGHSSGRARGGP
jgi:hypothetical protein